jgi:YidC/Oxa1 family membrane protein insertase
VIDFVWEMIGIAFNYGLVLPMTNVLVAIARVFGGNFGIAIIIFTIIMRLVTWPLTSSQYKQSRAMQSLQPKLQEVQKKYKNDRQAMQRETMALYKEHGVNPLGCLLPMLVQMPIWIALYRVIQLSLGETPESLVVLSHQLYPIPFIHSAPPLETDFLIWNLGQPDTLLILPILVGVTMYVQQKMITPSPTGQGQLSQQQLQQQQTQQMMTWMLPVMFAYFSFNVPSGLALYWAVSNIAGIVTQYFMLGRRVDWRGMMRFGPPSPTPAGGGAKALRAQPQAGAKAKPTTEPVTAPGADIEATEATNEAVAAQRATGGGARRKRHGRRRGKR